MKSKNLRIAIPLIVILIVFVGFMLNAGVGTLSAFGWGDISLLCPLGALSTMLASKMMVPRAVVSLIIAIVAIALLGRAFCAWVCPVPTVSKLKNVFVKKSRETADDEAPCASKPLSEKEKAALKNCSGGCESCADMKAKIDSRHLVLGGSLLSAAIFGFPVFCLICPIGLTFATIMLLVLLFGSGDVTWSVIVAPALLLVEVVFFKKWCSKVCPLSAFMSLVGKLNKTFKPTIDDGKCLETSRGATCGICASVCEQRIDPRHPEKGAAWNECTKCRACVDACPANAISMPLMPSRAGGDHPQAMAFAAGEKDGTLTED